MKTTITTTCGSVQPCHHGESSRRRTVPFSTMMRCYGPALEIINGSYQKTKPLSSDGVVPC